MSSVAVYARAISFFSVSSVGMMLCNKLAVRALPLPCTLVLVQMFATLALLCPFKAQVEGLTFSKMRKWSPVALLFTVMLYTSMESFVYANLSTILTIRNLGSIVTTVAEYYILGEGVNASIILSQFVILFGAIVYSGFNTTFSMIALFWMLFNLVAQGCYGILVKHMISNVPEFSSATRYTLALYNNALSIPVVAILLLIQEGAVLNEMLQYVEPFDWFWIGATCLLGFMISTSGFALQKLVSAATFIVINNITKFLNIIIGVVLLGDPIGLVDGSGCAIAFLGGAWYSVVRYQFKDVSVKNDTLKEEEEEV